MKKQRTEDGPASISRRGLLLSGAAATAAGGLAMHLAPGEAQAAGPVPETWDEEFDVVVIGSGFAGLAAAYEAASAGASVTVLEKMRTPGGNSIIAGGVISAAGSPLQAEAGIEDSPELMLEDILAAGLNLNHIELARLLAYESWNTVQWTIEELGVSYRPTVTQMGGHSVPRLYGTSTGAGIINPQLEKLAEFGIRPRTQSLLVHLLRDGDGRVKGVEIREGYQFPNADSGTPKTIRARKAVVLATGGFGADIPFRTIHDARLTDLLDTTNHPGATSESLREALRIGCTPVHLYWIQLGPWTSPDERGFGINPYFSAATSQWGLWINTLTGRRFVSELADRRVQADAIVAIDNNAINFMDAKAVAAHSEQEQIDTLIERGIVRSFDSLEDMAAGYDVPVEPLLETVESFNRYVAEGADPEFDRYMQVNQLTIDTPPYYASRLAPKVHHTMGGVRIDARAQALDISTDEPIPGLYAAGEITGGVHGASRLGSIAILDCLLFGRIAGQNAAAETAWD